MLSRNLQSLFNHLHKYTDTGMKLKPEAVFMICAILEATIDDALELESRTVPLIDQYEALPKNVVRLVSAFKAANNHAPGGGDAA